jgi:hypothetical protein
VDVMTAKQEGEVGVGKSRKSRKRKKKRKIVKLESLKQLNLNAGGLDIGAAEIYAAVPEGRDEESVRRLFLTTKNSGKRSPKTAAF